MPQFTVGQDCQLSITGPFGKISIANQTGFTVDQTNTMLSSKKIDGSRASRVVFDCWTGMIEFDRTDDTADQIAQSIQQYSLAGTPIPNGSITYQVINGDGTTSRWQLTIVTFDVSQLGKFNADQITKQVIKFQAEQRSAI
jgi:hypothetical protein